jgi:ribosomal protein L37E
MASNTNIRMPFLPTVPLPVNVVSTGMMYMYSCSQCDFKTHIEGMFKQHVDSIHLGITTVSNNIMLSNTVATLATAMPQTGLAGQTQTLVMTTSPVASLNAAALAQTTQILDSNKHKCLKCGFPATSKNALAQHKRKFHGKNTTATTTTVTAHPPQYQQTIVQTQVQQHAPQPQQQQQPAPQPQQQQQQQQQTQQQPQQQQQQIVAVQLAAGTNASGKKTYTCSSCGYSTTRRDGLSQHYDSVHLKIKNHQCDLCPYAASQKGTLNRHVKLRHKKKDMGGQANAS